MAFLYYPGVHVPFGSWDAAGNPNEMPGGSVRTIVWTGKQTPTQVRDGVSDMQAAGKFVIVCIQPGPGWTMPLSDWTTAVTNLAAVVSPDAWEIGNEPDATYAAAVGGAYWPKLRSASNVIRASPNNALVILAAPVNSPAVFWNHADTENILSYIDGWALHPYASTPANQLGVVQARRTLVDGFSPSWSALPVYLTETGWTVKDPSAPPVWVVPPGLVTDTTQATQAGNLYGSMDNWRINRTALKIRTANWFVWQDAAFTAPGWNNWPSFCGLKKGTDARSVDSPPAALPASGYRPAYYVLRDQFQDVYDGTASTPPVVTTVTPPTGITTTGATLQGTVNPQGKPTTFYFDYGPTTAYGTTTVGAPAGSGSTVVAVQKSVTGLVTGQVYHYRCRAVNSDSPPAGNSGLDKTFTTLAPPLGPTVNRGPVTSVTTTTATIWGSINPNGAAISNYHFDYGLTTTYGGTTTAGTLPSGNVGQLVGAGLTGLTPGATYHYRLVATNSQGTTNGVDGSFTVTAPPTSTAPELSRLSVLSTLLSVEITTADSRSFRWDAENADVKNRPLSIRFATQQGDGFAEASCELPRPIGLDWSDLHLLDRFRLIGADASIAYEGRVAAMPRRIDSEGEFIGIQATGLMSTARDRTFTDIIVDRLGGSWQEPSLPLRKATLAANKPLDADYTASVDSGSIHFKGTTNKLINAGSQAIVEYIAPNETKLASFQYMGTEGNVLNESSPSLRSTEDDTVEVTTWANTSLTLDGTLRTATPATPASIFGLRMNCGTAHGDGNAATPAPATPAHRQFEKIAVYSDHGITLQGNGDEPDGVFASDVIANLIARFCPLLNADGVAQTTTVISHLVFDTPTTPFDAFATCNAFHLWSLGSWEGGKVIFEPADFGTIDWQIRSDDMGVTFELQGDASDQFANGLPVSYTDINDRAQILWPRDEAGVILYDELVDTDPDNDANKWGYPLWPYMLELSNPVDLHGALTLGKVALSEFNRRKAPGSVNLTLGYIEDGQGNLQPGWKVRAGQTLAITDLPNDEPRLITGTSWTEDGQLQITVEQPSTRVDAVLARLETSSQARGL